MKRLFFVSMLLMFCMSAIDARSQIIIPDMNYAPLEVMLASNTEAYTLYQQSQSYAMAANIMGGISGSFLGYALGYGLYTPYHFRDNTVLWSAVIGAAILPVVFLLDGKSAKLRRAAVTVYNNSNGRDPYTSCLSRTTIGVTDSGALGLEVRF